MIQVDDDKILDGIWEAMEEEFPGFSKPYACIDSLELLLGQDNEDGHVIVAEVRFGDEGTYDRRLTLTMDPSWSKDTVKGYFIGSIDGGSL